MNNRIQRFWGVQYLRAIAALMIAYYHLTVQVPAFESTLVAPAVYLFNRGVDIFFVISGFVMITTGAKATPGDFIRKRLVRIVPLYWTLTLLVVAVALIAPHVLKTTQLSTEAIVKSLLFIPFHNAGQNGELKPLLIPGWSLNYEMFFYGVFALALLFARQWLVWVTGAVLAGMVVVGMFLQPGTAVSFYCDPIILEFWVGMLIGKYVSDFQKLPWVFAALLLGAGIWMLFEPGDFAKLVAAGEIVLAVGMLESRIPKVAFLATLGDASYSIYLLHLFVFGVTRILWRGGPIGFALVSIGAVCAVSVLSYLYVEKGFLKLLARGPIKAQPRQMQPLRN